MLDKPNKTGDVEATWIVAPGSAEAGNFTPDTAFTGVEVIHAGELSAIIEMPTLDDSLFEGGPGSVKDLTITYSDSAVGNEQARLIKFDFSFDNPGDPSIHVVNGAHDTDLIYGTSDDDSLSCCNEADEIFAREGSDILIGGSGDDILVGGAAEPSVVEPVSISLYFGHWAGDWIPLRIIMTLTPMQSISPTS